MPFQLLGCPFSVDDWITLTFDPVDVEEAVPAVAFDVTAEWKSGARSARFCLPARWFTHQALNAFEAELDDLADRAQGTVLLRDWSEDPVIEFDRHDHDVVLQFSIHEYPANAATLRVSLYAGVLREVAKRLRAEKWW